MIELYKILNGKYDKEAAQFVKLWKDMTTRTGVRGNSLNIFLQRARTGLRRNAFALRVMRTWNTLPDNIVTSRTTNTFKNRLDKYCKSKTTKTLNFLSEYRSQKLIHIIRRRKQLSY